MIHLLIVESPAKCKKIQEFLGDGWRVQATMGHIRALKEELSGIGFNAASGVTQAWSPTYESISTKTAIIAALRSAARGATVYLGSDDDREGEAIAWHTCQVLGLNPTTTPRVIFHEITAPALRAAVASPRRIDMNKFNAQQARSMLDLLIGFTLSPCLWRTPVAAGHKGLSAGRCQTPTLRLIYDRDREIAAHQATNTWRLKVTTEDAIADSTLEWSDPTVYSTADAIRPLLSQLATATSKVVTITNRTERISTSQPPKPFITSTLQQEASSRLSMAPKATMRAAQTLYEAGHITYMRTDNAVLSQEATEAAAAVVTHRWGAAYLAATATATPEAPTPKKRIIKKKVTPDTTAQKAAENLPLIGKQQLHCCFQNAHEGIRPTHMEIEHLPGDEGSAEQRLYDLIWRRTIQSVMAAEQRDVVRLTGTIGTNPSPSLTTDWDKIRFAGWRVLNSDADAEATETEAEVFDARAQLVADTILDWQQVVASEQRSTPAARYTEASLIRELEKKGIGRPSTYATLVETVLDRAYIEKATIPAQAIKLGVLTLTPNAREAKRTERTEKMGGEKDKLRTTELGRGVMEWLLTTFSDMVDYDVTADMETHLDEVSRGVRTWDSVLSESWTRYAERYAAIMATPAAAVSSNKAEFGDGYKMILSKKGPLFVHEQEGAATRFASVPAGLTLQTATRADAEAAFAVAATGEMLGDLDGEPVVRRKGQYGSYVTWGTVRLTCTAEDTLDALTPKLREKRNPDAVDHQIGCYRIKSGAYGLYMYRTGGTQKPVFVSVPAGTSYATLTVEGADALYKHCLEAKKSSMPEKAKGKAKEKEKETEKEKPKTKARGKPKSKTTVSD